MLDKCLTLLKLSVIILKFKNKNMKTRKMNLANIQGKLSRSEMKNILAGCGGDCNCYTCCWTGTTNCSITVCGITNPSCVSGATAVANC